VQALLYILQPLLQVCNLDIKLTCLLIVSHICLFLNIVLHHFYIFEGLVIQFEVNVRLSKSFDLLDIIDFPVHIFQLLDCGLVFFRRLSQSFYMDRVVVIVVIKEGVILNVLLRID